MVKSAKAGEATRDRRRGFTLTELLVVIVIIGVLVGVLFPVGSRVLESSRSAKCIANLRQLHTAANLWTADNNGWMLPTFPSGRNADNRINSGWVTALFPYLSPGVDLWKASDVGKRPNGVLACPSSKFLVSAVNMSPGCTDYGKNSFVNRSIPPPGGYPSYKLGGMENMSKVIFLGDSNSGRELNRSLMTNRHNGLANVIFYDGHVESLDPAQVRTDASRQPWSTSP